MKLRGFARSGVGRGFTLVEMLVTLALMAMISALLWQAMHQVMRVEQVLQRSGVDGQLDVVRREWLRGLIQASLVEQTGGVRQLQGDGQQLTVASAEALSLPGLRSTRLQIRFESDARSGRQRVLLAEPQHDDAFQQGLRKPAQPIELLTWEGKPGKVRFLDEKEQWHDQWPPPRAPLSAATVDDDIVRVAQAALPRLPRAVLLDLGADVGGALIVSLSVTEPGRLRLAQWEQF